MPEKDADAGDEGSRRGAKANSEEARPRKLKTGPRSPRWARPQALVGTGSPGPWQAMETPKLRPLVVLENL